MKTDGLRHRVEAQEAEAVVHEALAGGGEVLLGDAVEPGLAADDHAGWRRTARCLDVRPVLWPRRWAISMTMRGSPSLSSARVSAILSREIEEGVASVVEGVCAVLMLNPAATGGGRKNSKTPRRQSSPDPALNP